MSPELKPYSERTATVVGSEGALGSRIKTNLNLLGFQKVLGFEKDGPFNDFVNASSDIFFAVSDVEISNLLKVGSENLKPHHTVLDGASIKTPLISSYRELDERGISVCSTHLGSSPNQPWRGVKVWICQVGENSQRAKHLAIDMFVSANSSIRTIGIEEHANVERDQWITMATTHIIASILRRLEIKLEDFDTFSTLNSELLEQPVARTLGQGTKVPSEIVFGQNQKEHFMAALKESFEKFSKVINDRDELISLMQANIDFHNDPHGFIESMFKKAGVIGARNANLRMHSLSFRITDDEPGKLIQILEPFRQEGVNLTAIDSMPGSPTTDETENGVNPDKVVDFDFGIDPKTIDIAKEERIKEKLAELGCKITAR